MGIAKRIIPCLDVDNGRVVKGVNFMMSWDRGKLNNLTIGIGKIYAI